MDMDSMLNGFFNVAFGGWDGLSVRHGYRGGWLAKEPQ